MTRGGGARRHLYLRCGILVRRPDQRHECDCSGRHPEDSEGEKGSTSSQTVCFEPPRVRLTPSRPHAGRASNPLTRHATSSVCAAHAAFAMRFVGPHAAAGSRPHGCRSLIQSGSLARIGLGLVGLRCGPSHFRPDACTAGSGLQAVSTGVRAVRFESPAPKESFKDSIMAAAVAASRLLRRRASAAARPSGTSNSAQRHAHLMPSASRRVVRRPGPFHRGETSPGGPAASPS